MAAPQTTSVNVTTSSSDRGECDISLVLPEEQLLLTAPNQEAKNEWLVSLQRSILEALSSEKRTAASDALARGGKHFTPPLTRNTSYLFTRVSDLKNAEYQGAWLQGKMHGLGMLSWPDGRTYRGQFRQNQKHGFGTLETVDSQVRKSLLFEQGAKRRTRTL